MRNFKTLGQSLLGEKFVVAVVVGGWVSKPILVFSFSFDQAEQYSKSLKSSMLPISEHHSACSYITNIITSFTGYKLVNPG